MFLLSQSCLRWSTPIRHASVSVRNTWGNTAATFALSVFVAGALLPRQAQAQTLLHRYSFTTSTVDSVGGANATLFNGASISANAVQFDGVDDYVALPAGITATLTNLTIEAWVNWSPNGNYARIFDFGDSTANYMFLTTQIEPARGGNAFFAIGGAGAEQSLSSFTALPSNTLAYTAVTIDGVNRTGKLYINGVLVAQNNAMTLNPALLGFTANNWLGRSEYFADPYFKGSISEFRIYNGVLSNAQVAASYAAGPDAAAPEPEALSLFIGAALPAAVSLVRRRRSRK